MLSHEADGFFDLWRASCPASLPWLAMISLIPLVLLISSSPALALSTPLQVPVYRMHQYDLSRSQRGCRSSLLNLEARTIHQIAENFARKCIILKLVDLVEKPDILETLLDETLTAGLLILLPTGLVLSQDNKQVQALLEAEKTMLNKDIYIPVYFTYETPELLQIYDAEQNKTQSNDDIVNESNLQKVLKMVNSNGHQLVVSGPQAYPVKDVIISSIQGKLTGSGVEDQLPTIAFVAHYDSFSLIPNLSFGFDSNGSGVAVLLELARIFSKLYSNSKTQPKFNLLFLLSGGGKFNFFGSKKWIDELLESGESTILLDSQFVVCLDSLADVEKSEKIFFHVSKPPKEGSSVHQFYSDLQTVAQSDQINISLVHKKINLADDLLSWEHERFRIRRIPAFTLSSLNNYKSLRRKSIVDTFSSEHVDLVARNAKNIADAIVRQIYPEGDLSNLTKIQVSKTFINSVLVDITNGSRYQQLLLTTEKAQTIELPSMLMILEGLLRKSVKDIKLFHHKVDKSDPEVVFYEPTSVVMTVYNVKPAFFDLVFSVIIGFYLLIFYYLLNNFHQTILIFKKLKWSENRDSIRSKIQ